MQLIRLNKVSMCQGNCSGNPDEQLAMRKPGTGYVPLQTTHQNFARLLQNAFMINCGGSGDGDCASFVECGRNDVSGEGKLAK
jgi:hypothetical protein